MALQSTHLGRVSGQKGLAREALRFLDQAEEIARHEPSPKLHALIGIRRSVAASVLGDTLAAAQAITTARRELDRGPHPADPHWSQFITESEINGHEVMSLVDQGRPGQAVRLYEQVLQDPALPLRNRAFYQARLSATLLEAGDTGSALREGHKALPALEGPVSSVRTLNELRPVRAAGTADEEFTGRFDAVARALIVA